MGLSVIWLSIEYRITSFYLFCTFSTFHKTDIMQKSLKNKITLFGRIEVVWVTVNFVGIGLWVQVFQRSHKLNTCLPTQNTKFGNNKITATNFNAKSNYCGVVKTYIYRNNKCYIQEYPESVSYPHWNNLQHYVIKNCL